MKLFVVLVGLNMEAFNTFAGIYSTREKAEKRLAVCEQPSAADGGGWDETRIEEIEVDKDWEPI